MTEKYFIKGREVAKESYDTIMWGMVIIRGFPFGRCTWEEFKGCFKEDADIENLREIYDRGVEKLLKDTPEDVRSALEAQKADPEFFEKSKSLQKDVDAYLEEWCRRFLESTK